METKNVKIGMFAFEGKKFSSDPKEFSGLLGIVSGVKGDEVVIFPVVDVTKKNLKAPSSPTMANGQFFENISEVNRALLVLQKEMPEQFRAEKLFDSRGSSLCESTENGLKKINILNF